MRIPRLYLNTPLSPGEELALDKDRAHYVINVLRLEPDRPLIVFNGEGGEYAAKLTSVGKKHASIYIDRFESLDRESALRTELAIGVSRGERMDWVIQKATELGVTRIVPLLTERTEVKLSGERADKKQQHWRNIIISACEQCQRNVLPELAEPMRFDSYLGQLNTECRLVMDFSEQPFVLAESSKPKSVSVLVGPEGGLSDEEIKLAHSVKFQSWTLGPRVLRTETAPISALSVLQFVWGDL